MGINIKVHDTPIFEIFIFKAKEKKRKREREKQKNLFHQR